ncbi:hypothetical protein D3C71_1602090 [compost metagenome]
MGLRQPDLVHAPDAGDEIIERGEEVQQRVAHLGGVAREHADVAAGAKHLARGAQAHHADFFARFQPLGGLLKVAGHGHIDGVHRIGTVKRQGGEGAFGLEQQRLERGKSLRHGVSPISGKYQLSIQKPRCYGLNRALAWFCFKHA